MMPGTLVLSSIAAHELYFGAYRSQGIEFNLETLRLLFADLAEFRRVDGLEIENWTQQA